ncbi:MAG: hypothetical protein ACI8RD_005542 [Bacillariaceae sp.]
MLLAVPFADADAAGDKIFVADDDDADVGRGRGGDGDVRPPLLLLFGEYLGEFLGEFDDRIVFNLLFDGTGDADLLVFGEMERFGDIFVSRFLYRS